MKTKGVKKDMDDTNTLMLRLSGVLQSFGIDSKHWKRDTGGYPTKSMVVGMLGNAAGKYRYDSFDEYRGLRMCSLVEREGRLYDDYQAIRNCLNAQGSLKNSASNPIHKIVDKWYVEDGKFIVALESSDKDLLKKIYNDVVHPKRLLYLGRKCCAPYETIPMKNSIFPGQLMSLKKPGL